MKHKVETTWSGEMSFESDVDGHKIEMDAKAEFGGKDIGPTPKPLLLAALAGCTGMDTTSLLKKMRVEVEGIKITATGELTEEHPRHYKAIHLLYEFSGKDLKKEKIEKAVTLSQERYCGVSYMLGQVAKLTYEVAYKEEPIEVHTNI